MIMIQVLWGKWGSVIIFNSFSGDFNMEPLWKSAKLWSDRTGSEAQLLLAVNVTLSFKQTNPSP